MGLICLKLNSRVVEDGYEFGKSGGRNGIINGSENEELKASSHFAILLWKGVCFELSWLQGFNHNSLHLPKRS